MYLLFEIFRAWDRSTNSILVDELHVRGGTSLRQANMGNDKKDVFFIFDFHILP